MSNTDIHTVDSFIEFHRQQFEGIKLPKILWKIVHKKLYSSTFMADEKIDDKPAFEIKHIGDGTFDLVTNGALRKWGNVYIIPHIFVATKSNMIPQLLGNKELVDRFWNMMDLDSIVISEPTEKETPKNARPAPVQQEPDEEMIQMILDQTNVTRERAVQALVESQNDFVEALNNCESHPELRQMEADVNAYLGNKYGNADPASAAIQSVSTEDNLRSPKTEQDKFEQRAHTVFSTLFSLNYLGSYMVMEPRGPNSPFTGPPHPEEITTRYFVLDEYGSAIQFSNTPNVRVAHFVCIPHGNIGYTLVWPEQNIASGQSLLRQPIQKLQPFA